MSSASPIKPVIQDKLNEKRKILNRQNSSAIYSPSDENSRKKYQQNIVKTPYIIMVSTEAIQPKKSVIDPNDSSKEIKSTELKNDFNITQGFYMLSNQEYSNDNLNINVGTDLYNARNLNSEDKVQYRPAPGIKDLTSEFTSTNNTQFNRKLTINFVCYSLKDLEVLTDRFMTFNRRIYAQWGWATTGQQPVLLIDEKGDIITQDPNKENKSDVTLLQDAVIEQGQGDFDAVIGYVNNFNFSLREDGGFDCTTEFQAQGVNILDTPLPTSDGKPDVNIINKGVQLNEKGKSLLYSFSEEINNLHTDNAPTKRQLAFGSNAGMQYENLYEGLSSGEIRDNPEKEKFELFNFNLQSKKLHYNKNFIITSTQNTKSSQVVERKYKEDLEKSVTGISFSEGMDDFSQDPNECWVRWGWIEDNIINKYFAMYPKDSDIPVTYFRSVEQGESTQDTSLRDRLNFLKSKQFAAPINPNITFSESESRELAFIQSGEAGPLVKEIKGEQVSTKVNSDVDFKTTDIRQFLFPGKFSVAPIRPDTEYINKLKQELEKTQTAIENTSDDTEKVNLMSQEKKLDEEYNELSAQLNRYKEFENIEKLREDIKNSKVSAENLNQIAELGYDKYLFLNGLENALNSDVINPFDINEGAKPNGRTKGYMRNIFINIGFLQSQIFSKSGATTIGEAMNLMFRALNSNTNGLINLIVRYDSEKGKFFVTERQPGETYQEQFEEIVKNENLYTFSVHQQDSMVLSQELSSDLSSTQFQVLMSKNLAEIGDELSKKNISLNHQQNLNNTLGGVTIPGEEYITRKDLQSGYSKYGDGYGFDLASESVNIQSLTPGTGGGSSSNPDEVQGQLNINTNKEQVGQSSGQGKKDLESAQQAFSELPIPYTIEGILKDDYYQEMLEKINIEIVDNNENEENEKPKAILKVSDYGLVGITTTLTLTGIAGIYPSNVFTSTYLPDKFKFGVDGTQFGGGHFWTTGVTQNCSAETWTTQIEARMQWKLNK